MVNIKEISISPSDTALRALQLIDDKGLKIALVVDGESRLLATLTDGDIRRGLLRDKSLTSPVSEFMNEKFFSLGIDDDHSQALTIMRSESVEHIPVLDRAGRVTRLIRLHDLIDTQLIPNPIVIMAGGKGTRLRPYTENCPKPMLEVAGRPILEIVLERCISMGFSNFYFSVNYLKHQIIDYFGDGSRWHVSIQYLEEETPMGTAGSLQLLPRNIRDPIIVLNGDVLTQLDLARLLSYHIENQSDATICVRQYEHNIPFGVVNVDGLELESLVEKPSINSLVNAGLYVINPDILTLLPASSSSDMPTLIIGAKESGRKVIVYHLTDYWIDIGRPETLKQAHQEWTFG